MSDYEYVDPAAETCPALQHMLCAVCQSLCVEPVRVLHVIGDTDCGASVCRQCHEAWASSLKPVMQRDGFGNPVDDDVNPPAVVGCPLCRAACPRPRQGAAVPDRLLARIVGHVQARCNHCGSVRRTEDMADHMRGCAPRRLDALRNSHNWLSIGSRKVCLRDAHRGSPCAAAGVCVWGSTIITDLLPSLPTETCAYLRDWMMRICTMSDTYMFSRAFQALAVHAPDVIAELWNTHWISRRPSVPNVVDMIRVHDLLPSAHSGMVAGHLEPVILSALRCSCDRDGPMCCCRNTLANIMSAAGPRVLTGLPSSVWEVLVDLSCAARDPPVSGVTLQFLAFAMERELPLPAWTVEAAEGLCVQPQLELPTLARIISNASEPLLSPCIARWRCCLGDAALPLPGTWMWTSVDHYAAAAATIAALDPVTELALPLRNTPDTHMLSQMLCALAEAIAGKNPTAAEAATKVLPLRAIDPVPAVLRRTPVSLILALPIVVAALLPISSLPTSESIIVMLTQGHRFVSVHSPLRQSWMESFLGYLVLLLRTGPLLPSCVHRIRAGTGENTPFRGMLMSRAMGVNALDEELHTRLVVATVALANGLPTHTVLDVVRWLGDRTERTRVALLPAQRPIIQMALNMVSAEAVAGSLAVTQARVLRFLLAAAPSVPAAMEWLTTPPSEAEHWLPETVDIALAHPGLIDQFVYAHMFRPGVSPLVVHTVAQDSCYSRRCWQPLLRLHGGVTGDRPAGRSACALARIVAGPANPPTRRDVADAADLLVCSNAALTWRWWMASRANEDAEDDASWPEVRTWALTRLRTYLEGRCWTGSASDATQNSFEYGRDARAETDHALLCHLRSLGPGEGKFRAEVGWIMAYCAANWARDEACRLLLEGLPGLDAMRMASALPRLLECAKTSAPVAALAVCLHALVRDAPPPPAELVAASRLGDVLDGLQSVSQWLLLRAAADLGRHRMWAALVRANPPVASRWFGAVLQVQDKFGALGRLLENLVSLPAEQVHEDVLQALSLMLQNAVAGSTRLQQGETVSDDEDTAMMPASDLQGPIRDIAILLARHYTVPHLAAIWWPPMSAVHHSHLGDIQPETMVSLLEHVDGDQDPHNTVCFVALLGEWVRAFGASMDTVWQHNLAPPEQAERLGRVLRRCQGAAPDTAAHLIESVQMCTGLALLQD